MRALFRLATFLVSTPEQQIFKQRGYNMYLSTLSQSLLQLPLGLPVSRPHTGTPSGVSALAGGHLLPESVIATIGAGGGGDGGGVGVGVGCGGAFIFSATWFASDTRAVIVMYEVCYFVTYCRSRTQISFFCFS